MQTNRKGFSFQYNVEEYKLLEYVYPVAQEYAPDFDYNENTGESFMAVSQVPDIFKGRYNARKLRHKFTVEEYMQDKELQGYLKALNWIVRSSGICCSFAMTIVGEFA